MLVRELIAKLQTMDQDLVVVTPSRYATGRYVSMDGWWPQFVTIVAAGNPSAANAKYADYDDVIDSGKTPIEALVIS